MPDFSQIVSQARTSPFRLRLLNAGLARKIPFNLPHKFRIQTITDDGFEVHIPYRRKNMNHLKGIHACALATASEFVAGIVILRVLGTEKYRFIMKELHMEYHYQARMDCVSRSSMPQEELETKVLKPLETQDVVMIECFSEVHDVEGNHISTCRTLWQIKCWDKVKTKL